MSQPENGPAGNTDPAVPRHHPRRLIFAPGDIEAPTSANTTTTKPTPIPNLLPPSPASASGTSTPSANAAILAHPARAHQFLSNPPLTLTQLDRVNPLHQFHAWFRDARARLGAAAAPETASLATACAATGRVSARVVYLKELDERGWVVYSNWGSKAGKGAQVFGSEDGKGDGNRWAALTFHWAGVERQVRVEGVMEILPTEESETYWRVRERGSQIGAWASRQSEVLWEAEPGDVLVDGEDGDDGREVLEERVREMEKRFEGVEEIPLPPFWGGARLVPESVEFWQGRKSRLHDRFRYVRVHSAEEDGEKTYKWRIQRLSP